MKMKKRKMRMMKKLIGFPCRKFFGATFATLGGFFALAYLMRSLLIGEAVPEGVIGLVGILTGGFGAYVASSSYEATRHKFPEGEE